MTRSARCSDSSLAELNRGGTARLSLQCQVPCYLEGKVQIMSLDKITLEMHANICYVSVHKA